jgi:hypothetical protein
MSCLYLVVSFSPCQGLFIDFIHYARFDILVFSWHCASSWLLSTVHMHVNTRIRLCGFCMWFCAYQSYRQLTSARGRAGVYTWIRQYNDIFHWKSFELTHVLAVSPKFVLEPSLDSRPTFPYIVVSYCFNPKRFRSPLSWNRLYSCRFNWMGIFCLFLLCGR